MHHHCNDVSLPSQTEILTRRGFLRIATLGGGAALFAALAPRFALASGNAEAILLSCMDYRLIDDMVRYMDGRGLNNKYDHVVLAGASLGAVTHKTWASEFWEHLDIAIKLHHVKKVIVMDHRDCGAYKLTFGEKHAQDPVVEKETHAKTLRKVKGMIHKKHPELQIELLLMDLQGAVEGIG
ncbi:MAG: carbonic anhydrase [Alphaproteobacteria bacterium]